MKELSGLHVQQYRIREYSANDKINNKVGIDSQGAENRYTIDEILDRVESADITILQELNIPFTEIKAEDGSKKISFKYEGVRYTVNIIEVTQTEQFDNRTQITKNDDGTYTVFEYDVNGNLLKSTDYDKDNRITHEYIVNDEESHSDKYYTYENGKLTQVQETIHYSNGNYTYIFTDGEGNLTEEQKVLQNEYGGVTFDSTFGDGTRHVIAYNDKQQVVGSAYYNSDGILDKTEEYVYNSDNPDLYTVITRDKDGNVLINEEWENYTFTDENGGVWYGSRLLERIEYDNNIEKRVSELQSDLDSLKDSSNISSDLIAELEEELADIKNNATGRTAERAELYKQISLYNSELLSLKMPTPPNIADYLNEDGSVNEAAYSDAMSDYEYARFKYDSAVQTLEARLAEIYHQLSFIEQEEQKDLRRCEQLAKNIKSVKTIQQMLDNLEDIPENKDLINQLKAMLEELSRNINTQHDLQNKMDTLNDKIFNDDIPIPPSTNDFLKEDGSVDEEAYAAAFEEYENAVKKYENKINRYNALQTELEGYMNKLTSQVSRLTFDACTAVVENKIAEYRSNGNNAMADDLEIKLNDLKNAFSKEQEQLERLQQREATLVRRLNNLVPPIPPSTEDYLNSDGSVDESAYSDAVNEYEYNCYKFDRIQAALNSQLDKINDSIKTQNKKLAQLQSEQEALI